MLISTMYLKIIEIGKVSNMSISTTKKDDDDLEISLTKLLSDNIFRNCRKAVYPQIRIIFQYSYRNWYFEQLFSIYIKGIVTYFPRCSRKAIGLWYRMHKCLSAADRYLLFINESRTNLKTLRIAAYARLQEFV